ncbi:hypothetical protein C8Q80DRAFT_1264595 [Daedaleopsis nitida]|nr:hypothetical protein C8Q80DRAFT_1264595 [Daedaleopsis nitida]
MRLQFGIVAILASGLSAVAARTSGLRARSATDICGDVAGELTVQGRFGAKIPVGYIDKCFCLSQIPILLKTDPIFIGAVIIAGEAAVKTELTDLLNKSKDHKKCVYPDEAEPICVKGDPCSFKCKNGFTAFPDKHPVDCVCKPPHKVCNGVCGPFKVCPSHKPYRRDALRKRALCGQGQMACGIFGRFGDAWECINTDTDLESCGGCAIPLDEFSPSGVDCTAIPGVLDVSCLEGACAVHRCAPGFTVSKDGESCTDTESVLDQNPLAGLMARM